MRPIHYEVESGLMKKLISDRCDFFLGGRGIGIRFYPLRSGYWELDIERARVTIHADKLVLYGDFLEVYRDDSDDLIARIDLKHYLKVTVVW